MKLSAEHMQSLPEFFKPITDPRRPQGRRHPLPAVLAIATAAVLCGAQGYPVCQPDAIQSLHGII